MPVSSCKSSGADLADNTSLGPWVGGKASTYTSSPWGQGRVCGCEQKKASELKDKLVSRSIYRK